MSNQNQHYITRELTKPWEGEHRRLYYYDFRDDRIKNHPSKNLFSGNNLWSPFLEPIFNKLFERSLAKIRLNIEKGTGDLPVSWQSIFALYYLIIIHLKRSIHVHVGGEDIESEFGKYESNLPAFVIHLSRTWELVRIPCHNQYLCFPESVIYPVPIKNNSSLEFGYVLSLSPHLGVGMIKRGWSRELLKMLAQMQLSGLSVGIGEFANRVLVTRQVIEEKGEDAIKNQMKLSRKANLEYAKLVKSRDPLTQKIWENIIAGLYTNGNFK